MQLTGHITPENHMSLEACTKYRKANREQIMSHRQLRSVHLGEHINLQFESETTVRYQIQEMLRIEKVFEEEGILCRISSRLKVSFSSPITTIGGSLLLSATKSQPPTSPLTVKPSFSRKRLTGR